LVCLQSSAMGEFKPNIAVEHHDSLHGHYLCSSDRRRQYI
jgi:hypothetical protein